MSHQAGTVTELAADARTSIAPPERRTLVGPDAPSATMPYDVDAPARFELYHFAWSLCSHKVRMTLAEKRAQYGSHDLVIFPPHNENYHPAHVRLRLASETARTQPLARNYNGVSSVQKMGLDPLVVPTLVDNEKGIVMTDSKKICLYLARELGTGTDLLPDDLSERITEEIDNVDFTPHVALLYGPSPERDDRLADIVENMQGVHAKKIAAAEMFWAPIRGQDPLLDTCYEAKIAKEKAASIHVSTPDRMRESVAETDRLVGQFRDLLERSEGPWIFGERFTLADVVWTISLFRLQFLGYGWLWQENSDRAVIADYTERAFARDSMRTAVREWPGHPVSDSVAEWFEPAG